MHECLSWLRLSVFNLQMRVCSSTSLPVLLEMSPFNIAHSRSDIEWSSLLKCLASGSPLLFSRILLSIYIMD